MRAKIIAMNHEVITYTVNGRKCYIVDRVKARVSAAEAEVFSAINCTDSHNWQTVYDFLDDRFNGSIPDAVDKVCDKVTIF